MNTKLLKFAAASMVALVAVVALAACGGSGGDNVAARLRGDVAQAAEATQVVQPSPTPPPLPPLTETPDLPNPTPVVVVQPIEVTRAVQMQVVITATPPQPGPQAQPAYTMPAMPNVEPCPVVNGRIDSACTANWRRP